MIKNKCNTGRWARWIFAGLILSVIIIFVMCEVMIPAEETGTFGQCQEFNSGWKRILEDGTGITATLPVTFSMKPGEVLSMQKILPQDLEGNDSLCFRSAQQDVNVYIDEELRYSYSTEQSRPFGKNSVSAYLFVDLQESDAGKLVRVECVTDSVYTGVFNAVYYGDKLGMLSVLIENNGIEFLVTCFLLLLGLVAVIISVILKTRIHKDIALEYLGWAIFCAAMWIMGESKLRQFIFPNVTAVANLSYYMILIMPIPFLIYADMIQNYRYHRLYRFNLILAFTEVAVCSALQFLDIYDFRDTLFIMRAVIGLSMLVVMFTVLQDFVKGYYRTYLMEIIGMGGVILGGVIEVILVYQKAWARYGIALSFGLIFLLAMASMKTAQNIFNIEKEKERAVMDVQSKDRFLANMSHEIRTPINTMMGMNQMILRESTEPEIIKYAQNIDTSSKMLLALVNDILDFSKIESGNLQIIEGDYQLSSTLNDTIQILKNKADNKELEVILNIDESLPSVLNGDEIRIKQILINLMTNAVKYTKEGTITFSVEGRWSEENSFELILSVADTGEGIKEENLDKLFTRFIRLEERKNQGIEGTGLGLSITKQLVEKMDGTISVESVYGSGSLFTVVLPQKVVDKTPMGDFSKAYKQVAESQKTKVETKFKAPWAEILVVDDNEMNLAVARGLLKPTQIKVDTALSGKQCLELTKTKKYHLIFMDHMMPEMDGIETLHLLQQDSDNPNSDTKVIVLTANAITGIKEKYLEEGFSDYLSKPIAYDKMESMLEKYLTRDILSIDREQGIAYCGGMEEFYQEMLTAYCEQAKQYIPKLIELYEKKDWENYRIVVHAVKSNSLNIGAIAFSESAKEQEMAAKEGRTEDILNTWGTFINDYKCMREKVESLCKTMD